MHSSDYPPPPTIEEMESWPKGSAAFAEKMASQSMRPCEMSWEKGDLTPFERILVWARGVEDFSDLSSQDQVGFLKAREIPERYWSVILDKANDPGKIAAAG